MKKIVFVNLSGMSNPGGAERVLSIIANKLYNLGYHISILSYKTNDDSFYPLSKNINRISLNYDITKSKITLILAIKKFRKLIKLNDIDYVIPLGTKATILTFISLIFVLKVRKVSWVHYSFYNKMNISEWLFRHFIGKYFDKVIILNKSDVTQYKKYFENIVVHIPNPAPFSALKGSSQENHIVIAAGRLVKIKGFDSLIKAFALVLNDKNYSDWKLEIYGSDGGEKESLLILIKELKISENVSINEATSNINEKYLKSDIYAMSSLSECFPMVLLEAQQNGLPIISFDCNSGPRDIVTNSEDGFLIKPYYINEYANKLAILMNNPQLRREMGQKGKENVKRFSNELIIKKWQTEVLS
jgi:glycosyltransferase involved in cell wall biosynthesis